VTLNGGTINTSSILSNKIGGVTLCNNAITTGTGSNSVGGVTLNASALSGITTITTGTGSSSIGGVTLNASALSAASINNGAATFTISNNSLAINTNTLTVSAPTTTGCNAILTTGNITAQDFIATSDRRLKSDIATICNAMDIVKGMRGVYFTRIGQSNRSTGVIAQEVEEVLPEVVHTSDDGMKSVSYGNIVGVLIEAVKVLSERLEKMET